MPKLIRLTGQMQSYWKPASEEDMEALVGMTELKVSGNKTRTSQQQKAIEVYCRELARALNAGGLDQRAVMSKMREGVEIPWRQESVKEVLWREVQKAAIGKDSTTALETKDVGSVYEILNRWTAQALGVSVPFPDRWEVA